MTVAQTAIRLATSGKAEVRQDFADVEKAGTDAMAAIAEAAEASATKAETAADRAAARQEASYKRMQAAAKIAAVSGANQDAFNGALSAPTSQQAATVNLDRSTGAARASAAAFQEMFDREEAAAAATARLRAAIDPLYVAQKRYDDELTTWRLALEEGSATQVEHDAGVAQSASALAKAKRGLEEHSNALGFNRTQFIIAESATHRFIDSILAGQSPLKAAAMQAGDFGNVLAMDDGGVAGGLAKVRALFSPTNLLIGASVAAFAAATAAGVSYANAMDRLAAISQGAGRVIGATGDQLEANAEAAAHAGHISVSSARDIEVAYVQMGGIGGNVLAGLTGLTDEFAKATGQDSKAALQQLGAAFQDPAAGADQLTKRYGFLTQAQVEHIHDLVEQNDLYGAQAALLDALKGPLQGAADHVNILSAAWHSVETAASNAWTAMGKAIDRAAGGGSIAERIADLQSQRASLAGSNLAPGATADIDRQIADLRGQLLKAKATNDNAAARSRAVGAMAAVDGITGDDGIGKLRAQLGQVNGLLADNGRAAGLTAEQLGRARTAQADLTHAVQTYLPEADKQVRIAQLDAQMAATKDPAKKAELATQKAQVEQAGKLVTSTQAVALATAAGDKARAEATKGGDKHAATLAREAASMDASARAALTVAAAYLESGAAGAEAEARRKALTDATKKGIDVEAEVRRQLALSVGEAAVTGAKSVSTLKEETAARVQIDYAVKTGALSIDMMNQALGDENALRDLTIKQTLAYKLGLTAAYDQITATIKAYKQALSEAHAEEAHGQALQSLDALKARVEDAQLALRYAGDTSGAGDRAKAALAGDREADKRGYDAGDRRDVVAGNVAAADAEMQARRAASVAEMLKSSRDNLEVSGAEVDLVGKSALEHDRVIARLQTEQKLRATGVDLASDQAHQVLAAADAEVQLKSRLQLVQDSMAEVQQLGATFIDDLTNPDGSGVKKLLKDVEQELIKLAAINPLKNLLGGGNAPTLGSVFKLLSGASGFASTMGGNTTGLTASLSAGAGARNAGILADFAAGHNAGGTEYWSGGKTWVGEFGPELIDAPRGARITNAADTRRMMSAANDGGPRTVHNHFTGNLLTPEFWAQIQSGDDHAAIRGAAGGASMAASQGRRARRRSLVR